MPRVTRYELKRDRVCWPMRFLALGAAWIVTLGIPAGSIGRANDGEVAEPKLRYDNWEQVRKFVSEADGEIIVVNIWTTTCPSCLVDFPKFSAFLREFHEQGVVGVAVNCDYDGVPGKPPKWYATQVKTFLRKHPAPRTDVVLTDSFLDFLEAEDLPSTPATYVFESGGRLLKRFAFDPDLEDDAQNTGWDAAEDFVRQQLEKRKSLEVTP